MEHPSTRIFDQPWLTWVGAVVLGVHGLVHLMGVALLLQIAEPGDLTYADARPEVGTTLAVVFALFWAVAAVLFVVTAVRLIRDRFPINLAIVASLVSTLAITPMVKAAPVGLALSVLILIGALWFKWTGRPGFEP